MNDFARHQAPTNQQRRIAEEAAEWYLDQREGLSAEQHAAFMDWLCRSPAHVAEYLAMTRLHGDLAAAAALDPLTTAQLKEHAAQEHAVTPLRLSTQSGRPATEPTRRWRRAPMQAAAAALVLCLGAPTWLQQSPVHWDAYASDAGQVRSLQLDDGSQLELDANSIVLTQFDLTQRRVELWRGGALVDVAHDPARPLKVRLGRNELQDIGTVFDVHLGKNGNRVTVISGRVKVWQPAHSAWMASPDNIGSLVADLSGGQQARLHDDGSLDLVDRQANLSDSTAWLPSDIHFEGATVAEVARRFNAYTTQPLDIEDAGVAATRISGRFHARDVDAFITYLQTLPGVQVARGADSVRVYAGNGPLKDVRRL
ncbi:FecR family protein [Dyella telluris]|uniref:FecR domain-containing protein n=1 Tax=Dyella telluris TaxID=2763498 RepID=A0A7G8Q5Z7_9GAMM|nr:FecR domain-containing protein [Dyella telluris]QNK02205.1 FecR domain-containing protein [Dyella telluris]